MSPFHFLHQNTKQSFHTATCLSRMYGCPRHIYTLAPSAYMIYKTKATRTLLCVCIYIGTHIYTLIQIYIENLHVAYFKCSAHALIPKIYTCTYSRTHLRLHKWFKDFDMRCWFTLIPTAQQHIETSFLLSPLLSAF